MTSPDVDRASTCLRDDFAEEIILPGDADYDDARTIFNAMINRSPSSGFAAL